MRCIKTLFGLNNFCAAGAGVIQDVFESINPIQKLPSPKKACIALVSLEECRSYDCPICTSPSAGLIACTLCTSCKRAHFLFSFILSFWSVAWRIVLVSVFESHRSCVRLAAASYEVIHNMKSRQDMNFNFSQSVLDRIPKAKRSTRSLSGGSRPFSEVSFKTIWFEVASADAYFEQY